MNHHPSPQSRLHYLDAFRAAMMILGIIFHAAWLLLPEYFFHARWDVRGHGVFRYFFGWVHVFRMQAFFMIAGFFAHLLVEKRGLRAFVGNRFRRVLLPFLAALVVFFPVMRWQELRGGLATGRVLWEGSHTSFLWQHLSESLRDLGKQWPYHLWFLETLCFCYLFSVVTVWALDNFLDSQRRCRDCLRTCFARWSSSAAFIPTCALPVAALMWIDGSWFGIGAGALWPNWVGTLTYWFIFGVGWYLYASQEVIPKLSRFWPAQLIAGSVIALVLSGVWYTNWLEHRQRVGPFSAKMDLTVMKDYSLFRRQLLATDDSAVGLCRAAVRNRLDARWVKFVREHKVASPDQIFGLVTELNKSIIGAKDFATPQRCAQLEVVNDHRWGEAARRPLAKRTTKENQYVNSALFFKAFSTALRFGAPPTPLKSALYFYAYAVSTWLLVWGWCGFFRAYFSTSNQKARYYSDAAYWLYLIHLPIQFEMSLWMAGLQWPVWLKFVLYSLVAWFVGVLSYHFLVRSTWVGGWLNGRRYPLAPFWRSAVLPERTPLNPVDAAAAAPSDPR